MCHVLDAPAQVDALALPSRPKPIPGQPWLQVVSKESTAYDVAYAITEVFEEKQLCEVLQREPFAQRLAAVMPYLSEGGPRRQLALACQAQEGRLPTPGQRSLLLEASRRKAAETIAGSWRSTRSALVAWAEFCRAFGFAHFPVQPETAQMFAVFIRHGPTLQKYFQHLRWAHRFLGQDNTWWRGELQQATRGACKVAARSEPARPALQANHVQQMVSLAEKDRNHEVADLFAVARGFLFRVPSEMLPLRRGPFINGYHSGVVFPSATEACVTLASRKNSTDKVDIRRSCSCHSQWRRLCAVHHLMRAVARAERLGRMVVFGMSYSKAREHTRNYASKVGMLGMGTHAFRRGAAQDMAAQGCQLFEILQAGGWKSAAFMAYLKPHELEAGACAQLVADHSDSDSD